MDSRSVRVGGTKLDEAIVEYVRHNHNLVMGEVTAEEVKIKIGSATKLPRVEKVKIKGRDTISGLPRTIELSSEEVWQAMEKPLSKIVGVVKSVIEVTPPELVSDIIDKGLVMSGGTSTLRNLDTLLTKETGIPAYVAEEPLLCVVKGTGVALSSIDKYKRALR